MYKCLRKLGSKRGRAPESSMITVNEYKENFERVSRERCEEDLSVIASMIVRVIHRRGEDYE